jgi:hypothetical protein
MFTTKSNRKLLTASLLAGLAIASIALSTPGAARPPGPTAGAEQGTAGVDRGPTNGAEEGSAGLD